MNDIPDIASCELKAVYNGGEAEAEGNVLTIKPNTVCLNFMRYTLARTNRVKSFIWPQRDNPTAYEVKEIPNVDGHACQASLLRKGYLYLCIYNKNKERTFKEFETEIDGTINDIPSDFSEDVRLPNNYSPKNSYSIKDDDVVWIAFSEYQWSAVFVDKMRTVATARNKRMQKFDAAEWIKNQTAKDAYTVNEIDGYIPLHDEDEVPYQLEDGRWTPGKFNDSIDYGNVQWWIIKYDNAFAIDDEEIKKEAFICLHDPLGCAEVLSGDLGEGILLFKALVEALQTGGSQKVIYESLLKGQQANYTPNEDFLSLFRLALSCYLMVYHDEKMAKKLDGGDPGWSLFKGYGLDKRKVEGILGLEERNEYKEELNKRRELLGNFVQEKYVENILDDYLQHNPEGTLEGIVKIFSFLRVLFTNPSEIDITLLLPADKPPKLDKWQKFVIDLLETEEETPPPYTPNIPKTQEYDWQPNYDEQKETLGPVTSQKESPLKQLLTKQLDIDRAYSNFVNLSNKLSGYGGAKLTFLAKQAFATRTFNGKVYASVDDALRIVVSKMNRVTAFGKNMYQFSDGQIQLRLGDAGAKLNKSVTEGSVYTGKNPNELRVVEGAEGFKIINSQRGKHELEFAVHKKTSGELTPQQQKANRLNQKAGKILNGTSFTGTIAFLQVLNMQAAVSNMADKRSLKSGVSFIGVTADLTEASLKFYQAYNKEIGKKIAEQTATKLTNITNVAGFIGGGITSAMCFLDAVEAANRTDTDAALAWAGAGIAYGTAAGYSIYLVATKATTAGPLGWIAAGIGLGFVGAAIYFTDSPSETYFKNFILSDRKELIKQEAEPPMNYTRRILKYKSTLVKSKYQNHLMLPQDAEASLFDVVVCQQVHFKGDMQISTSRANRGGSYSVKHFNISIDFYRLLENKDQLEYDIYFYRKGIKESKTRYPFSDNDKKEHRVKVVSQKNGVKQLKVKFSIPDEYQEWINEDAELLFVFRLNLHDKTETHFPHNLSKEKNRYMAAKANLAEEKVIGLFDALKALNIGNEKSPVRIGIKDFILDPENW